MVEGVKVAEKQHDVEDEAYLAIERLVSRAFVLVG